MSRNRRNRETKSSAEEIYSLRVYYMRIHEAKDELQPKMNFNNNIVFIFDKGKQLDDRDHFRPFIYTCNLDFKMNNGILNVLYQNKMKPIGEYHLEISRTIMIYGNITRVEQGSQGRSLNDCFKDKHHFIFNTHFDTRFRHNLPGRKNRICSKYIRKFFIYRIRHECSHRTLFFHLFSSE